jgi:S-adenosylmethionine hydrolase
VPPIIALLTDFGNRDPYVGAMKGAILLACPEATLVDVVHEVPAHDVEAGARALDAVYRHFPAGTVFVAVVDPGVGSGRRPVAVGAGEWLFVGPDNGIFTPVLETYPTARVHLLANPRLWREPSSPVFHGRDLFGPAAGRLAGGLPLEEVGPALDDPVRLPRPDKSRRDDGWQGAVIHVDRFGNLITNIVEEDLETLCGGSRSTLVVEVGEQGVPLVRTYSDVPEGRVCALVGSSGRLEVAANRRSAAALLGASVGTPVVVTRPHPPVVHSARDKL